jgi:protein pelota
MKSVKFYEAVNVVKLVPESFEDLYLLAMIISVGDKVSSKSYRRFKADEGDVGEQKEVFIKLGVEKTELDKGAGKLRLMGKILEGRPEQYIRINSYHTLSIGPGDMIEIEKGAWSDFIIRRIKQAVVEAKRPRLGIIAMDDEKATIAYVRGYGIDLTGELYSNLSKKMKEKDFGKQLELYFKDIIATIERMDVEIVIIAGPGFMKDDIKKFIEANQIHIQKRLVYVAAADAERSGIREVMKSEAVSKLLESEHVKKEFEYLDLFFRGIRTSGAVSGLEKIRAALSEYRVGVILVNDSVLNNEEIKALLDSADRSGVRIEIFNSDDEAGRQLSSFKDIAAIEKSLLK